MLRVVFKIRDRVTEFIYLFFIVTTGGKKTFSLSTLQAQFPTPPFQPLNESRYINLEYR